MTRLRILVCVFAFPLAVLYAEKKPITIDTVLDSGRGGESPGKPVWAPDGRRFLHEQGKRLMLYDVPSKHDKLLLPLDALEAAATKPKEGEPFGWQNRRVSGEDIQWSRDGKSVLLVAEGDLFLWHMDSSKWDQLTATPVEEADPKFSPDGMHVAFRRGHDLYVLDVASRRTTRLTSDGTETLLNGELDWVYPEELDLGTAYWWSPDSKRIAYLQFDISHEFLYPQVDLTGRRATLEMERYPQAGTPNPEVRLGVISADGGETKWMDLGDTRSHLLARVYWTPDSKALAVYRFNRIQTELDFIRADATTGAAHVLIHESDKYWINISGLVGFELDQFTFLKDGRFLWASERDGFRHLYLYSAAGELLSRVTNGPWEVTAIAGIDETHQRVLFVSNEPSPLERQLYSVGFDGSGKQRLTEGEGTHSISMSPALDYYLDTYSSLTQPPLRTIHSIDGGEWTVYRKANNKLAGEYELLPTEIVSFKTSDSALLYGKLIKPANFQPGRKYPLVVMVYGGPGAQSIRNAWSGASWEQVLAQRGFVVWQVDNRGSFGRGHAFETPIFRRLGERELADQKEGIQYLIRQGFVDPQHIGMYGWSYGGFMTLYSLLNAPELFRAGIAGAPVTDWHNYDTIYTERYLGLPSENEEGYKQSSAVTYASKLRAKLLIVHNMEDDNVLFQNTLQMANALEQAGKEFSMIVYPQKSHGVTGPARRQLLEATTDFFERNLK
jgi:dipeptidyl-peptidase-4